MSTKPNLPQPKMMPYLSIVEGRRPHQKLHTRLGDAKNAFDPAKHNDKIDGNRYHKNTHGWGQIYEFVDGDWVLLYDVPQPTEDDSVTAGSGGYTWKEYETRPWRKK